MEISGTSVASQMNNMISPSTNNREVGEKNLTASDFLEILVTEMTNQDPLEPMNDKEFMAQMAQFSSLEEMSGLNKTMSQFVQSQQLSSANAYLGHEVTVLGEGGVEINGQVTAVSSANSSGKVMVTVNDKQYDTAQIKSVRLAKTGNVI